MSRIPPLPEAQSAPLVGPDAPLRARVIAQAPDLVGPYTQFMAALRTSGRLSPRLIELLRLRVAFHNQCRSCMAIRYAQALDDGLTEQLVCSLERPAEADDLSEAERVALGYADLLATDHLAISDATFDELRLHFDNGELMELCLQVGTFVGYGRMSASLAMTDDLPEPYADPERIAPWSIAPASVA